MNEQETSPNNELPVDDVKSAKDGKLLWNNTYFYTFKFIITGFKENEMDLNVANSLDENKKEYVNGQGVRFTTQIPLPYTSKWIYCWCNFVKYFLWFKYSSWFTYIVVFT